MFPPSRTATDADGRLLSAIARRRWQPGPGETAGPAQAAGRYPEPVLAAAVLAAEGVSFVLVGSAALWLHGQPIPVAEPVSWWPPGPTPWRCGVSSRSEQRMGDRSGVGLVEVAILEALDSLGARPGRNHFKNSRVLAAVQDRIGLAPGYAYDVLVDLARSWTMPLGLIEGHGNFGSRGYDPAANPRYTESRLSAAG